MPADAWDADHRQQKVIGPVAEAVPVTCPPLGGQVPVATSFPERVSAGGAPPVPGGNTVSGSGSTGIATQVLGVATGVGFAVQVSLV